MKVKVYENRHLEITQELGTQNENNIEKMELEVPEKYQDWIKEIVFITDDGTVWDLIENDTYIFKKNITKYEKIKFYIRLVKDEDDFRSVEEDLYFNENHEIEGEVTPEEESDIERIISILEGEITKVDNMDIDAVKVGDTATITITDKNGISKSVEIKDGQVSEAQIQEIIQIVQETIDIPENLSDLNEDSTHRTVTDSEKTTWNNKSDFSGDYGDLSNKPKINSIELNGNKTLHELGIQEEGDYALSSEIPTELSELSDDNTHRTVTDNEKSTWNNKQEALVSGTNIKTINNQSILGEGNINMEGGSGTTDYSDLENKPKINNVELNGNKSLQDLGITEVTEQTVAGWGFTKNTGTYSKPSGGIPKTDLESLVQTSLNKADTALQSYTETDPTVPSHVKNISQADISNWNNKSDFSGDYNDLDNKPVIPVVPTNISAFTNDVGYLTQHQDISGKLNTSQVKNTNSTTAGDVYDVRYINTMIGDIETVLTTITTGSGV